MRTLSVPKNPVSSQKSKAIKGETLHVPVERVNMIRGYSCVHPRSFIQKRREFEIPPAGLVNLPPCHPSVTDTEEKIKDSFIKKFALMGCEDNGGDFPTPWTCHSISVQEKIRLNPARALSCTDYTYSNIQLYHP